MNHTYSASNLKYRRRLIIALLAIGIPTVLAAVNEVREEYVPGSSEIEEANILKRMELELGQKITPQEIEPRETAEKAEASQEAHIESNGIHPITLILKNNSRIQGNVYLSQSELVLHIPLGGVETSQRIPLEDLRFIKIEKWKAVRATPVSSENRNAQRVYYYPEICTAGTISGREVRGRFESRDWLQLNLISDTVSGNFRTYFTVEQNIQPNPDESNLETINAGPLPDPPETTVTTVWFGDEVQDEGDQNSAVDIN
ncbi:MAG: hypothetical protein KDK30_17350 [Leptospiraceae bacterium]|nr:hypothetical protein [Leptospiraceae bacterium]